jgi:hypothetical protein
MACCRGAHIYRVCCLFPGEPDTGVQPRILQARVYSCQYQDDDAIQSLKKENSCIDHVLFCKKPRWVRRFYGDCTWEIGTSEKVLYLSFDDGPDERETPFVLEQLSKYNAKGTFFCIGKNVLQHPGLFESLTREGHTVGNHTFSHIDGWKTSNKKYFDDIAEASKVIRSGIFPAALRACHLEPGEPAEG